MIRVLFICHGNICRSPMAEFIMKDLVNKQGTADLFHIESRATSTEEIWNGIGNPVYPPAKAELKLHGLSCEGKRAQQVDLEDYRTFDYLLCMDSNNVRNCLRLLGGDPEGKISKLMDFTERKRDVADPWYTGDFQVTYRDIEEGCISFYNMLLREGKI